MGVLRRPLAFDRTRVVRGFGHDHYRWERACHITVWQKVSWKLDFANLAQAAYAR